jgi:vacuolar-type H+-ATPase subunit I/STV1
VLLWQATYGMLDALLVTAFVILPMGLIALGTAMLGAPDFGKRIGSTTAALGVTALAAATALLVDASPIAIVGVFAVIVSISAWA